MVVTLLDGLLVSIYPCHYVLKIIHIGIDYRCIFKIALKIHLYTIDVPHFRICVDTQQPIKGFFTISLVKYINFDGAFGNY